MGGAGRQREVAADSAAMTCRNALPFHYPVCGGSTPRTARLILAAGLALLLAACASAPDRAVDSGPGSEPIPLHGGRAGAATPLDLRADDVLMRATGLIGTRYRYGGSTPQTGFDCSGFTTWVFQHAAGIGLPRSARDQFSAAGVAIPREQLRTGDLVFFKQSGRRIDHVGIYVGEGRFVHAPSRGGSVRIDPLNMPHWQRTFEGARRVLVRTRGRLP